jgi:hypothetical protein
MVLENDVQRRANTVNLGASVVASDWLDATLWEEWQGFGLADPDHPVRCNPVFALEGCTSDAGEHWAHRACVEETAAPTDAPTGAPTSSPTADSVFLRGGAASSNVLGARSLVEVAILIGAGMFY